MLGVGAGFLSEIIQEPMHRDASWEDVFADAVGVVCALALYALFDRRSAIGKPVRFAALAVVLMCAALYVAPIVRMTRAYLHRNGQFPVLADFSSRTELLWTVGYGISRELVGGALAVNFDAEEFPGVGLSEPVADWRNFKTLVIDVENPANEILDLSVRVHDRRHGQTFGDRFNRAFHLAAGERRVLRIPLADIRRGPRNRLMDMGHIADITLFRGSRVGSRQMRVYSLRLE